MARFETVLLTGGTGFVGSHLSSAFTARFPDTKLVLLCRPGEKSAAGTTSLPLNSPMRLRSTQPLDTCAGRRHPPRGAIVCR
jgi:nucleoside-diphosphate-sugar epimerase